MKNIIYTICLLGILSINSTYGQDYLATLKNQDYTTLESLLSNDVTVKVAKKDKVKGKADGILAIKEALSSFNPVNAESRHNGKSETAGNDYLIVKLKNTEGESMRIFIHLENSESGKRICDIKIRTS